MYCRLLHNQTTQYIKIRELHPIYPPNHSSTQIHPSILVQLLERPVTKAQQREPSETIVMETKANLPPVAAVIPDLAVE